MELTIKDLQEVIKAVLKNIKEEGEKGRDGYKFDEDEPIQPRGFSHSDSADYTIPSQEGSRYKKQGSANFGPFTEGMLRTIVRATIKESITMKPVPSKKGQVSAPFNKAKIEVGEDVKIPAWNSTKKGGSVWEDLGHWYDVPGAKKPNVRKLESNIMDDVYADRTNEKKIGFKKLKNKLAHKKGVKDPAALAASIGRKKYGTSGMAKKAAAGRKKK